MLPLWSIKCGPALIHRMGFQSTEHGLISSAQLRRLFAHILMLNKRTAHWTERMQVRPVNCLNPKAAFWRRRHERSWYELFCRIVLFITPVKKTMASVLLNYTFSIGQEDWLSLNKMQIPLVISDKLHISAMLLQDYEHNKKTIIKLYTGNYKGC